MTSGLSTAFIRTLALITNQTDLAQNGIQHLLPSNYRWISAVFDQIQYKRIGEHPNQDDNIIIGQPLIRNFHQKSQHVVLVHHYTEGEPAHEPKNTIEIEGITYRMIYRSEPSIITMFGQNAMMVIERMVIDAVYI